ncbi:hypothetical protein F2Q69_00036206 [Brassica cretica]|uniref:Uncharacterized protein n=1 Tax=Brassica cretica TaxID=69181 RepID=A0A8S9SLB6_BRACR|nr:hypothetical protein F2Q69_00036206 [Brassica cretica]
MLRDEEGRTRNSAEQLINAHCDVIPDVIVVAEMNDFDLSREWYGWVGQDPLPGSSSLISQKPHRRALGSSVKDSVNYSQFSQLQPGSLTSWEDIERAFLYKFLDDAEATREKEKNDKWDRLVESWQIKREDQISIQLLSYIMVKGDKQYVSGELSRVEEADFSDTTSASINISTATSIDSTTSTSTNGTTSTSIDGTTSESIAHTIPTSIDGDSCFRSTPLKIPERSSCPQDIADSTHKSVDISSCDPTSDGDREITIEDFVELEEFLELEDGEKLEDLDSSREVTMEDFLDLKEWLEDMDQNSKKKLDDDQYTSRGGLETSKASIDRHQPAEIDRQKPLIIDLHPPNIDRHSQPIIDRQHPPNIDRCPLLDDPPGCIVELEQVQERMYMSKASHFAVPKYHRTPIWTEEAVGFHKRVKRIHNPVKHVEASQRGLRFRDEVDKGPEEATLIDTDKIPSNDINKSASIDATTSPSIDTGRVSEQKEFDMCGNLRDGETTTRSDKSGGKKRRDWKKRKRIMGDSQLSIIPRFQMVSGNPECASDASHNHLQNLEHSLLLR